MHPLLAFALTQKAGVWSLTLNGHPFWSLGVCCTDPGQPPARVNPKNPGYSGLTLYPNETAWADATAKNLRAWGFNSLGGWSDANLFRGKAAMPFFPVLHLGAYDQAPWHDMFAPTFISAVEGAAKNQIPKLRDDPNLVGYFTDNELGWWGDTLFTAYFAMPAASPGKLQLVDLLKHHYRGDFARFSNEWSTTATGFETLSAETKIHLKPGTQGISVVTKWTALLARHYYRTVRLAVRRYDSKHLILGDRYCQYYDPAVVRAAKDEVDVISTNLGAEWNDGTTSHFFLDTLHRLTGKPVLISEFYMTAMENASGNRNSSGGFPVVQTQKQRAAAFKRYVESLVHRPYVIGAHWFQFYDEPPKGRGDGEDYNMGLVDIHGRPYPLLTAAAKSIDLTKRRSTPGSLKALPPAPESSNLKDWPRDQAFVPPIQPDAVADLYLAKDKNALQVGLFAMDFIDEKLYPNSRLPESERPLLKIELGGKTIEVRFGGQAQLATCSDSSIEVHEVPGLKHTLTLRIPGRKGPFKATLWSHSRGRRTDWRRTL